LKRLLPVCFNEAPKGFDQGLFQAHETVDMLMQVPAFDTQFAFVDRVGFQGQGALNFAIDDFEHDATAGSTVRTDRRNKAAIHFISPFFSFYIH
jgi:hypothetical protein